MLLDRRVIWLTPIPYYRNDLLGKSMTHLVLVGHLYIAKVFDTSRVAKVLQRLHRDLRYACTTSCFSPAKVLSRRLICLVSFPRRMPMRWAASRVSLMVFCRSVTSSVPP